jgi:hypothetical protein
MKTFVSHENLHRAECRLVSATFFDNRRTLESAARHAIGFDKVQGRLDFQHLVDLCYRNNDYLYSSSRLHV